MTSPSERKCLVVLGMHRSGTSALSGALQLTGLDLGKTIMPPADENPRGFFENMNITALNDKILQELFTYWSDTLFIPEDWWKSERFEVFAAKIKTILLEEFSSDRPMLIKDPRLSVLLPLYIEVFKQLGIKPVFLICVRNPIEVANSLRKRNNLSVEKSLLLWMDYQLKAELYSRNLPRIFISYSDFLKDPLKILRTVRESFILEMSIYDQTEKEILSFLDPALSHQILQERMPENSQIPELSEFYHLLTDANLRDFTEKELAGADLIRSRYSGMVRFYNGLPENFEATLNVQFENNEKIILTAPVKYGNNTLNFPINPENPVTRMVLRPSNSKVGLKIMKIEALLNDHSFINIDKITSNAGSKNMDGILIFETDLPKVILDFQPPISINHMDFSISYLAFGTISCRKALHKPVDPSVNPRTGMKSVDKKSGNELKKSLTWRIGRVVTSPARMIYKLFN